jgi:hypothetical protein
MIRLGFPLVSHLAPGSGLLEAALQVEQVVQGEQFVQVRLFLSQ